MGSGSTKVASGDVDRKEKKEDRSKKDATKGQLINAEEPNMPNMLVSLVRNKTVLVSEGRSVATQTNDGDWAVDGTCIPNGSVTYDVETVDDGDNFDHATPPDDVQAPMNDVATCKRERSDMGTNTVVTAIGKDKPSAIGKDKQSAIGKDRSNATEKCYPDEPSKPNEDSKNANHKQNAVDNDEVHPSPNKVDAECQLGDISLEKYGKYRVKVENDKEKCTISAVAFLDSGDLVLIDRSNHKIKYVDSEFRYISAQDLSDKPWAVCTRAVDVYVTIGNTRIQHLNVKDMLIEPVRSFEIKGRCLGICMFGEYIAVGLQIGEIHLLDTMGEKHGTIQLPVIDQDKPCNPWHMSVSREGNLLVTDSDSGVVFCVNKESQIMCTFKEMSAPRGTTVDSQGNILVVGRDNDSGVVVKILPRDWELQAMLHIEQVDRTGSRDLITWKELEFVPYCVDIRNDNVVVMGGIRESLKIMKLSSPTVE